MDTTFEHLQKIVNSNINKLHEQGYIVLKNLVISERLLARLAAKYGDIVNVGNGPYSKVSGKVFRLSNEDEILKNRDLTNFGNLWHHDYSISNKKGKYTFLYAVKVPPEKGRTFFMNMNLNEMMQSYLENYGIYNPYDCKVIHDSGSVRLVDNLVVTHPVNKKDYIYLGSENYSKVDDGGNIYSSSLIFNHLSEKINVYKHLWEEGDLIIWDNRIVSHKAEGFDSHRFKRIMLRCAVT